MKKNIVITAGGTSEYIDKVRKITNSSSGKLGAIITRELLNRDDIGKIYYICSKNAVKVDHALVEVIEIIDANDLKNVVEDILTTKRIDYFIHSMAVSDYTVSSVTTANLLVEEIMVNQDRDLVNVIKNNTKVLSDSKISSDNDNLILMLEPTPKIISLIKEYSPNTFLVGFKLLNGVKYKELINVASKLRDKNRCNLVVANDLATIEKGKHKAYIIDSCDCVIEAANKEDIAKKLVKKMYE